VLDCCYAGAFGVRGEGNPEVEEALRGLRQAARGVVLLAACGKNQTARENPAWGGGHGALSWAFLQSLRPPPGTAPKDGVLYLNTVIARTEEALKDLVNKQQSVVIQQTENLPLGTIPIAYVGGDAK
jgi:hypothetical protein